MADAVWKDTSDAVWKDTADAVWFDTTFVEAILLPTVSRILALKYRVHPMRLKTVVHAVGKKTDVVEKQ